MRAAIDLYKNYSKIFKKSIFTSAFLLPIILLLVLFGEGSYASLIAAAFVSVFLLAIIMAFVSSFRYFYLQAAWFNKLGRQDPDRTYKWLKQDFAGVSAVIMILATMSALCLKPFMELTDGMQVDSRIFAEVFELVNSALSGQIGGWFLILASILKISVFLLAMILSCRLSQAGIFQKYHALAAVFIFCVITLMIDVSLSWFTWMIFKILGGVEFMMQFETQGLIALASGFEAGCLILMIPIIILLIQVAYKGSFTRTRKKSSIKEGDILEQGPSSI